MPLRSLVRHFYLGSGGPYQQVRLNATFEGFRAAAAGRFATLLFKEMCRSIKTLSNLEPPTTDEEIQAAALQFVRKISGCNKPSKLNEAAFNGAVDEIAAISARLLRSLKINAPPRARW